MKFTLLRPGDLPQHARLLERELLRSRNPSDAPRLRTFLSTLADTAVTRGVPFLEPMKPRDIATTLHSFAKARVVHKELYESLVSLAARKAASFHALDITDVVRSLRHAKWRPSEAKLRLLSEALIQKSSCFTTEQAAMLLGYFADVKAAGYPLTDKVFATLGDSVRRLDALVGHHTTPRDIAELLWAHAKVRHANKRLLPCLLSRMGTESVLSRTDLYTLTKMLWSVATLVDSGGGGARAALFGGDAARRSDAVALFEGEVERGVASLACGEQRAPTAVQEQKMLAALLWSAEVLELYAADAARHTALLRRATELVVPETMPPWSVTILLWALVRSRVVYASMHAAAAGTPEAESGAYFKALVGRLCDRLEGVPLEAWNTEMAASVAWSLAALQHGDARVFACILRRIEKDSWWSLDTMTQDKLVELLCTFAEVRSDCQELQFEVAKRLHQRGMSAPIATRLAWALASSRQDNSKQLFHVVSLWAKKTKLSNLPPDALSNLLWAASSLDTDPALCKTVGTLLQEGPDGGVDSSAAVPPPPPPVPPPADDAPL
eukprot:Rhum_TRINITY_DN14614_c4_g1::Rhum_TRINITY_DN14614_c4_g1_i1::g.104245::m.104245